MEAWMCIGLRPITTDGETHLAYKWVKKEGYYG